VSGVVGVILAGGASRRFGSDKALARVGGTTMVGRIRTTLSAVCSDVVVSVDARKPYLNALQVEQIVDDATGLGPMGALATMLRRLRSALLITPCDMPLLEPAVLEHLVKSRGSADAVALLEHGRAQPFPGVYMPSCLAHVEECIAMHDLAMASLLRRVTLRLIDEREWRALDPEGRTLVNVNYASQLAKAE
jgi:molybdopterin-guanine dinucleotide biosynthesis protein A